MRFAYYALVGAIFGGILYLFDEFDNFTNNLIFAIIYVVISVSLDLIFFKFLRKKNLRTNKFLN